MKPILVSHHSKLLNELLQQARHHHLILQTPGGERFLLAKITNGECYEIDECVEELAFIVGESDDFDEEIAQTRQNIALMRFLDERAKDVKPGSGTSLEEIRQRLQNKP